MDPEARRFMWNVISTISSVKKQASIVLTTHSMEEAEALSSKLAIMVEGNIKCIGAPQSLKEKYGNGYEIEIKLKLPTKQELAELGGHNDIKKISQAIKKENLKSLFDELHQSDLFEQITKNGSGSDIWKMYERGAEVDYSVILEFVFLQSATKNISKFLEDIFGEGKNQSNQSSNPQDSLPTEKQNNTANSVKLLEYFQSFVRFKVEGDHKLHDLFGQMEENKANLCIAQYSIKQISIEQIFISLADQAEHDD